MVLFTLLLTEAIFYLDRYVQVKEAPVSEGRFRPGRDPGPAVLPLRGRLRPSDVTTVRRHLQRTSQTIKRLTAVQIKLKK